MHSDPEQSAASPSEKTAPPLWLGDPEVNVTKARAAYRAKFDAAKRWETESNLAAYDQVGTRSANWDDDAHECIKLASLPVGLSPAELKAAADAQRSSCQRALDHGCTDPFVVEIGLWLGIYSPGIKDDRMAQVYTEVENAMAGSNYPPLCKYVAAAKAVEKDIDRRRGPKNTIGMQAPGHTQQARSWPKKTDVKVAFQQACAQLKILVEDPSVPPMIYLPITEKLLKAASSDPIGRAEVFVSLADFFASDPIKDHPTYGCKLVEGKLWTEYAWDARGTGYAGTVTDDGWKLFGERLMKAKAALTEAWKLDPGDRYAPRYLITVAMGQGSDRDEMELWFRRAMDARPDDYDAGYVKMLYLEPKWGGDWQAVLDFGRQCYATHDWSTRMAMLLLSAHIRRSKEEADPTTYWKAPDVWADVHKLYVGYLAFNPTASFDRTAYALYASYAEQWKIAHEQFELIGDKPSEELLRLDGVPLSRYQDLRRQAAERASDPGGGGNGGS